MHVINEWIVPAWVAILMHSLNQTQSTLLDRNHLCVNAKYQGFLCVSTPKRYIHFFPSLMTLFYLLIFFYFFVSPVKHI